MDSTSRRTITRVRYLTKNSEGQRIIHVIGDPGTAILRDEGMFVVPKFVGTSNLVIDKPMRRIPHGDLAGPVHGQTTNSQLVFDERAGTKLFVV